MPRPYFDPDVLADPAWWHWAVTIPLLAAHLLGTPGALPAALLLCAAMAGYYLLRLRRVRPLPVQVRLAYLGWLLTGLLPGMQWMHYVALVGTTAMVAVGYCPLARLLGLLRFNRSEPLTVGFVRRQVLAPAGGGLFYRPARPAAACSLRRGAACPGHGNGLRPVEGPAATGRPPRKKGVTSPPGCRSRYAPAPLGGRPRT